MQTTFFNHGLNHDIETDDTDTESHEPLSQNQEDPFAPVAHDVCTTIRGNSVDKSCPAPPPGLCRVDRQSPALSAEEEILPPPGLCPVVRQSLAPSAEAELLPVAPNADAVPVPLPAAEAPTQGKAREAAREPPFHDGG